MLDSVLVVIRTKVTAQIADQKAHQSIWMSFRRHHCYDSVMENCWIPRGYPPDPNRVEDRAQTLTEHHDHAALAWKRPKQIKSVWSIH